MTECTRAAHVLHPGTDRCYCGLLTAKGYASKPPLTLLVRPEGVIEGPPARSMPDAH